jgi:O-antigen ligase/polysaccharide polymerase Wzy-like membrane protein
MKLDLRQSITLLIIGAYLILNWFFMLVRFPPVGGGGVPFGEILLIFWFCCLFKDIRWLPLFANSIIFVPFLIWWTFGITKALMAVPEHGMWALRDANHVIESLFVWVGFAFASSPGTIDRLFVWLRYVLALGLLYAFTYPWREPLAAISPGIVAASGMVIKMFSPPTYATTAILIIWEVTRRLIGGYKKSVLTSTLLLAYTIGIFQARTIYLQVIAVFLMLAWHRPKAFKNMALAMGAGLFAIILFTQSGIEIKGRNGEIISSDYIISHFIAIAGVENKGVQVGAEGNDLRLGWWKQIFDKLLSSQTNLLFGLGYGIPLVDFRGWDDVVVREPHNSFISVCGRLGLTGVILIIWIHIHLVRAWFTAYKLCGEQGYRLGRDRLFMFMVFFVMIWVYSLGEDAFEKPYATIPYYFFWGVVLHYRLHLKNALLSRSQGERFNESIDFAHPKLS